MRTVHHPCGRFLRIGTKVQAEFPSSYPDVLAFRPLRSTVITRFAATMSRSDSRPGPSLWLFIPPRRWSPDQIGAPPRRVSQVPQPICLRALSPLTPRSPAAACAHCFTTSFRFHPHWKTDHFPFALTRPKRVYLRYGSRIRRSRLRRRDYSRSRSIGYLLNGQLQDKLLSACKISQAFPGTPMYAPPAAVARFKPGATLAQARCPWCRGRGGRRAGLIWEARTGMELAATQRAQLEPREWALVLSALLSVKPKWWGVIVCAL
jgi:hypothetical protein